MYAISFLGLMDNLLLSSKKKWLDFDQTINWIESRSISYTFFLLSYSSVLVVYTGKILSSLRTHDLNESHIYPSTCSSTRRTSFKSGRFMNWFFFLISRFSCCLVGILCLYLTRRKWFGLVLTRFKKEKSGFSFIFLFSLSQSIRSKIP